MKTKRSALLAGFSAALFVGSTWADDNTPPVRAETPKASEPRGRGERIPDKLKVGDLAPDFTLKSLDGPGTTTLSSFRGNRPVVLIFGSYT